MRLSTMTKCTAATFMIAGALAMGAQANAAQTALRHSQSIDLTGFFADGGNTGTHAFSVAFDGTNAYVGGYTSNGGTVGVARVTNVAGSGPVNIEDTGISITSPQYAGVGWLAYNDGAIYTAIDTGNLGTSAITKYDVTAPTASQQWSVAPNGRPYAMDFNPANGGSIGYLKWGSGRIHNVNLADGSLLTDHTDGPVVSTPANGWKSSYRDISFDSDGNVVATVENGAYYGKLNGAGNGFRTVDDTEAGVSFVSSRDAQPWKTNHTADILEGVGDNDADLLVQSVRDSVNLTSMAGDTQTVEDKFLYITNLDGSITDLTQTVLTGDEDGVGSAWTGDVKMVAADYDANGNLTLLVASLWENRLDVYTTAAIPEPASLALLGAAGLMVLGNRRRK